jgi:hypothetical protein
MNALALLARAGNTRDAAVCPHPGPLRSNAILVQARRHGFILCPTCLATFQELIADWHGRAIGPRQVIAQMFALGYTRGDAVRFVIQLVADRLRLRVGLLKADQL